MTYSRALKLKSPQMYGEDVKAVQRKLNSLGFNCGSVDGYFGPKTDSAVRSFQRAKGLAVDGMVGPNTWEKLFNDPTPGQPISEAINSAIQWMINLANDDSHGYDQKYRWGQYGDYDCSSAVITAWEQAGVKVKTAGATYTGNMKSAFLSCGFKDVTSSITLSTGSGLKPGDVLLKPSVHTALYIGNGNIAHARINEKGTATGGNPGDQTGAEIRTQSYYNRPWSVVLRYES